MFLTVKKFTEKKPGQKVIFVGPYTGSWGHLFHIHIPICNYLRMEYPDAYIVSSSFIGDDYYHKDENGNMTIDAYIGFPIFTHLRKNYGMHEYPQYLQDAPKLVEQLFGKIDLPIITPQRDNQYIHDVYVKYKRRCVRLGTFAPPSIDNGDFVLLHTKYHPLLGTDAAGTARNPEKANEEKFIRELSKYIKVYIIGVPGWCYTYVGENVYDLTHLTDESRPHILLGLANKAKAMITTTASSTLNYALSVGCPSLVLNSRHYTGNYAGTSGKERDAKWNYYGVLTHNYSPAILDVGQRMAKVQEFLHAVDTEPRFFRDIVLHETQLERQL
jgi:hypothetical protein